MTDYYTSNACIADNDDILIKKDNANKESLISVCLMKIRSIVKFINNRRILHREYKYGGMIADAFLKEDNEIDYMLNYWFDNYGELDSELEDYIESGQWINS